MNKFTKATKQALSGAGWLLLRQAKGDHEIWHDPRTGRKVTVDGNMKSRHTANDTLKKAGLAKAF
jgi:predicted RNA binding protein YcfA (HicA-like mRNA interferase family)